MSDPRVVRALVGQYATRFQAWVEDRVVAAALARLGTFTSWYDAGAVSALAAAIGALVRSGQVQSAAGVSAYLDRTLTHMGVSPKPTGTLRIAGPLRAGVTSYEALYSRPVETYRYLRSIGYPSDPALSAAIDRLDSMVRTDLALARQHQGRDSLTGMRGVTGYRRIIHPELSKSGTCGLCAVAADQVYKTDELMPLHDRCKCTVLPIVGDDDPGWSLNQQDLDRIYEAAGKKTSRDPLKGVRVTVEQHGELGPVLVDASHRSKDPGRNRRIREARGLPPVRRPDTAAR
ncbi:MAG: hypothetical protein Q4G67_03105 [Actinomycetia bacterium]|nr:hypothetical protein [Actinomycetes bacterium]